MINFYCLIYRKIINGTCKNQSYEKICYRNNFDSEYLFKFNKKILKIFVKNKVFKVFMII